MVQGLGFRVRGEPAPPTALPTALGGRNEMMGISTCSRERERERDREGEREKERDRECVCEREREAEGEREGEIERERERETERERERKRERARARERDREFQAENLAVEHSDLVRGHPDESGCDCLVLAK